MTALAIALTVAALAGAPAGTTATCADAPGHATEIGYAIPSPAMIYLDPAWVCRHLTQARTSPVYFGLAVHVVVHEATHLTGVWNEYDAETRTQRIMPAILRKILHRLGICGPRYARVYRRALAGSEGWHNSLPANYRRP